jgi:hypothetical protein
MSTIRYRLLHAYATDQTGIEKEKRKSLSRAAEHCSAEMMQRLQPLS